MARRKKSETPGPAKPTSIVAVRKSSRQIARRQSSDGKKLNGDLTANNPEDISKLDDDKSSEVVIVKRKRGRPPKNSIHQKPNNVQQQNGPETPTKSQKTNLNENSNDISINSNEISSNSDEISSNFDDSSIVADESENLIENYGEMSNSNETENNGEILKNSELTRNLNENAVETLSDEWGDDDVIEETIICEEMEVETEDYAHQESDVVVEQVLVMDDASYEGKDVVYVIQNEDGTESMVMPEDNSDYQIIEEGVECLSVEETTEKVEEVVMEINEMENSGKSEKNFEDSKENLVQVTRKSEDKPEENFEEKHAINSGKFEDNSGKSDGNTEKLGEVDGNSEIMVNDSEKSQESSGKSVKNKGKLVKNSEKSIKNSEKLVKNCEKLVNDVSEVHKNSENLEKIVPVVAPRRPGRPPKNPTKLAQNNEKSVKNTKSTRLTGKLGENTEKIGTPQENSVKKDIDEQLSAPSPIPEVNPPKKIERRGRPRTPKEKAKKSAMDEKISMKMYNQSTSENDPRTNQFNSSNSSDTLILREDSSSSAQESNSELGKSSEKCEKSNFPQNNSNFNPENDSERNNNRLADNEEMMEVEKSVENSEESSRESDSMLNDMKNSVKSKEITEFSQNSHEKLLKLSENSNEKNGKFSDSFNEKSIDNGRISENFHEKSIEMTDIVKIEADEVKISSSSENSNDTASLSSIRTQESSDKSSTPDSDKKEVFRARSGSTDTTGSESGSNSSAIRRSSRIRSQGLAKRSSRGRGLVTKPVADVSRAFQQEREKIAGNALPSTPDSQSETQSDKENTGKPISQDVNATIVPMPPSPFETEANKPVKVKSRWRRSSELEMGNSAAGKIGFGILNTSDSPALPKIQENSLGESQIEMKESKPTTPEPEKPEIDAEVQERLSQFEILKENMYLTERYTNKETKRMTCDCFLTEEEVDRGELGCGEDCLNRLLMIECGSRCQINDRCTNKRFQNCEYAKCEVFRTEKKGLGLRAAQDIEAGEFIMEYVGEVLDTKDFRRRAKEYSKDKNKHYYFMALKSDQIIDATMKGNISRFINHSCDPNAETQKWTVNGELRIGFFNRRFIAAGEEITFDYHFQRYGKEAQKCFCEAANCRGWIGETPDEEKEKAEKKEKRERDVKKKREPKKTYMEDEDLEEEIDKLCIGGLKNRAHTLTLSRLMVRSREMDHRTRLLKVIQDGDQACRRLFLDYHGLRLIWSYMMDVADLQTEEAQIFRLELLKTLKTLPIPNKTMLIDSKVLGVVEKWSKDVSTTIKDESPGVVIEEVDNSCDSTDKIDGDSISPKEIKETSPMEISPEEKEASPKEKEPSPKETPSPKENDEPDRAKVFLDLSETLLASWSTLKEVFRIPKKERIEQMKEHEREADSGYREDSEKEERRETYDRHRSSYSRRDDTRRRGRESPDPESYSKNKERINVIGGPKMSKYERRQLFAMKVAKEEEERIRRQQHELFQVHESKCMALGLDPLGTPLPDSQTGYPLFFHPNMGQWQPYPFQDTDPMYMTQNPHPIVHPPDVSPGIPPPVYQNYPPPGYPPTIPPPPFDPHLSNNLMHNGVPPPGIPPPTGVPPPVYLDKQPEPVTTTITPMEVVVAEEEELIPEPTQLEIPPIDLPPGWKCAKDPRGRIYYYHVKERVSHWLPPPPTHIGVQPDSSSSSESSDETSSSSSEEDDEEEIEEDKEEVDTLEGNKSRLPVRVDTRVALTGPEVKRRRDGLVQERIISPRREEDRVDHKKYKDIKEKLRRQKERIKLKEQMDKMRKLRRASKAKTQARHTAIKLQAIAQSNELTAERKIKDSFRVNMATVMVKILNPYRQNDCKQGRITNTEDFKYLARKLTHFVMAKELKHCKSVDELQCNENVKHKAKDFVRKYMNKFGPVYQRSSDDD